MQNFNEKVFLRNKAKIIMSELFISFDLSQLKFSQT